MRGGVVALPPLMRTGRRDDGSWPAVILGVLALVAVVGGPAWTLSGGNPTGDWVVVSDVVDGDTIYVGRGVWRTKVRLKCVDTPETVDPRKPVECYGLKASEFTRQSLDGHWVHLDIDKTDQQDRYGRLLAYVFRLDGTLFNLALVRQGYARSTSFPCRYKPEFKEAEAEAQRDGRGLWNACEPMVRGSDPCEGTIIGNRRTHVYHLSDQRPYDIDVDNRVCFGSEAEATQQGYRRALR